jgi:hypothetical protein
MSHVKEVNSLGQLPDLKDGNSLPQLPDGEVNFLFDDFSANKSNARFP